MVREAFSSFGRQIFFRGIELYFESGPPDIKCRLLLGCTIRISGGANSDLSQNLPESARIFQIISFDSLKIEGERAKSERVSLINSCYSPSGRIIKDL